MSHTTTVQAEIRSARFIREAVADINKGLPADKQVKLLTNTVPRMYYANQEGECDYVLRLPGRYDVGLKRNESGKYDLKFDAWDGDVSRHLGDNRASGPLRPVSKFIQSYTKRAAISAAVAKGYQVAGTKVNPTTGEVQLTIQVNN